MDDDGDAKDNTKRRSRNLSEKKRRDQFNMLVSELSNLVTNNGTKMDKSSILKSTVSYLKSYNDTNGRSRAHDVGKDWKPAFLSNEEFTYLLLDALEAFVIVFSASGTIYYASDSILSLLGHKPENVINTNIFDLTYEEDRPSLFNLLQKKASITERSGYNTSKENETMKLQIHIRRGPLNYNRASSYELVQFYGHSRAQHDKIDDKRDLMDFEPRVLFVCIGRLHKPLLLRDVSLVDTTKNEFTSRHSLEWKFLFLDHRAPPIIGYLPFEVLGTSGYDYYHFDDLEKVVTCHEALMEKGELTSCHYRFLTKGQQWIWLQSRFYITYHQWNSKPEFVVCTHRVVSYDDVVETKEETVEQERTSETEANPNNMNETAPDDLMPMSPSYIAKPVADSYDNSDQSTSREASTTPNPHFIEQLLAKLSTSDIPSPKSNRSPTNVSPSILSPTKLSPYLAYYKPPEGSLKNSPNLSPRSMHSTNMSLNMSPSNLSPRSMSTNMSGNMSETDSDMPSVHPSYTAVKVSDGHGNTFHLVSQNTFMTSPKDESRVAFSPLNLLDHSSEFNHLVPQHSINKKPRLTTSPLSTPPPPLLDQNNFFDTLTTSQNIFRSPSSNLPKQLFSSSNYVMETTGVKNWQSHPASVKFVSASSTASTTDTVATTGASWPQVHNHYHDADDGVCSEAALLSEGARITHRNTARESHVLPESSVAAQYSIGAHYIDPLLYGSGVLVSPGMMSTMPAPAIQDQAQVQSQWLRQEQLQRKHEELQQMIVRQQEELRCVKEQLFLARLGMLQPIGNGASLYATPEELGFPNATQPMAEYVQQVPVALITLQPPQSHPTHPLPQQATHPMHSPHLPHAPDQQQNMPQ